MKLEEADLDESSCEFHAGNRCMDKTLRDPLISPV